MNGKPLTRAWLTHAQIAKGAVISYRLGSEHSSWGTKELPPSLSSSALPIAVRSLRPSPAAYFTWKLADAAADAPAWTPQGGAWTVAGRTFTAPGSPGAYALSPHADFSDFHLDADISVSAGGDAGLLFRVSPSAKGFQGYYVGLSTDSGVILGEMTPEWHPLSIVPLPLAAGSRHHLRVVANGSLLQVFVDDMNDPKAWAATTEFDHGTFGMRTWNAPAVIENLQVSTRFARPAPAK